MAYAASQYAFRQQEFKKYGAEASPAHVRELLDEIRKSARRLSRALARFQEMSARLSDGTAPLAGPHLSWLDEIIAQAMAGEIAADVNEQRLAIVHFRRMDFLGRLTDVRLRLSKYPQYRAIVLGGIPPSDPLFRRSQAAVRRRRA
jgi:hypothetical protein